MRIIRKTTAHEAFVRDDLIAQIGSEHVISLRTKYPEASKLDGYLAEEAGEWLGVLLYALEEDACELVYIHTMKPSSGIGRRLLDQLTETLKARGTGRLWVVTTNDNLEALAFYQKRGFRLVKVYPGAMDEVRRQKPEVPLVGKHGIPLRDMLELDMQL